MNSIHERLREERERIKMTQKALALAGGVTDTSQFNYENGLRIPNAEYLANVSKAGVDVLYVVLGERLRTEPLGQAISAHLGNFEKLDEDDQRAIQQLVKSLAMRGKSD